MSNLSSRLDNLRPKDITKTDLMCPACGHNESWQAKYENSGSFRLCTRCSASFHDPAAVKKSA